MSGGLVVPDFGELRPSGDALRADDDEALVLLPYDEPSRPRIDLDDLHAVVGSPHLVATRAHSLASSVALGVPGAGSNAGPVRSAVASECSGAGGVARRGMPGEPEPDSGGGCSPPGPIRLPVGVGFLMPT